MKLPNAELAWVDRRKVREYLLNPLHPDNQGKADFFLGLGYSVDSVDDLAGALRDIAVSGDVVTAVRFAYGEKYVVDGLLPAHTGTGAARTVRTVWSVDQSDTYPRLVTAYPRRG